MTQWTETFKTASGGSGGNIQDASIIPRIVGFYEYKKALDTFNELLRISTADEIEIYDDILKSKTEFGFFVGQPANLTSRNGQVVFTKVKEVHGLHWMTALARVELGAILSGFTDMENPFQQVPPTRFDLKEYQTLLNEGWTSHLFGVSQIAKGAIKRFPYGSPNRNQLVIKNARRAKLTAEMLASSAKIGRYRSEQNQTKLTEQSQSIKEAERLQVVYKDLQEYREQLGKELISQIQYNSVTSNTRKKTKTVYDNGIQAQYPSVIRSCARAHMNYALKDGNFELTPIQ